MIDPATLEAVLPFVAVGFAAQMVDGALGMAFGVISNTLLVTLGVPPSAASAGVHTVETFTTAVSGLSHIWQRNVDWRLFARLVIPGIVGGVLGAWAVSHAPVGLARPFVMVYLASIGLYLLWRGSRAEPPEKKPRIVEPLGLAGGFLDAAGGGGWGPVVTSNLLVQGVSPRITVGTVNTAEFFLTFAISATFIVTLGLKAFTVATAGLLIGGVIAAPFGAILARRLSARRLMVLVGLLLVCTSAFNLYGAWVG